MQSLMSDRDKVIAVRVPRQILEELFKGKNGVIGVGSLSTSCVIDS